MSISTCSQCGHAAPPDVRQCPKCGATLTARARGMASTRFQPGDVIDGRYEVVERLPGGGMGELYKVRHVHLGEFRVIKLLRDDQLADETQRKRFSQEARIAASIKHPNVGLLHDFASLADGTFYMVEEFIDGVTISRSIRAGRRFSLGEIVDITRQVLLGLVAIHEKGIIHRDISPDNLILCQNDGAVDVRIIDLGIAKPMVAGEGHALTSAGLFVGKPHYASPEQMRMIETDEKIDHRSDIYSLGVVIYEMIVGRVPFEAATPLAYLLKQVSEEIHTVNRDVSGVVPPELDAFIVRMLKTKRDERFATARDALRALDEAIAGIPQLLYRTELGLPAADESFPRSKPKTRKRGTDEIPFDQLAAIIQHDRTEPGATATPVTAEEDDDVPATEVQSLAGLMTTTQPHERVKPPFDTVEAATPPGGPDRTVPATTPVPAGGKARRRKYSGLTIAAVCAVFLVVVSAGGWLFYRLLESRFGEGQPQVEEPATIPTAAASPATASGIGSPEPAPTATATTATAADPAPAQPGAPAAAPATAESAPPVPGATPVKPPARPATRPARPAPLPVPTETVAVDTMPETSPTPPPPTEPAERAVAEGDIVAPGEGVVAATPLRIVEPSLPPNYAGLDNRGFAMFSVLVGIDGSVESARLIRSSGSAAFDELATTAARKTTFSPAAKDGVRVKMWRTLRFDMRMRSSR